MSGKLIAMGISCGHVGNRLLSQFITAMIAILISASAEAGFLSSLAGDACSGDIYKVGQVLTVTLKLGEIEPKYGNKKIDELGEYGFIHYANGGGYEIKGASWNKHQLFVNGLPTEQIKQFYKQAKAKANASGALLQLLTKLPDGSADIGMIVKIYDLDGHLKNPDGYCGIKASFERFDDESEKKLAQLVADENARNTEKLEKVDNKRLAYEQCVAGLDSISTVSGSTKELNEWRDRCEETIKSLGDPKGVGQKHDAKREEILKARAGLLLAGKLKIESYDDAKLVYNPLILESIASSPLLKADGKIYATKFWLTLDAEEGENLLRAVALDAPGGKPYVFLRTAKNTKTFNSDNLRIGGVIFVLGRYIGNTKYTTIMGVTKSAPTLEVMYMDAGTLR